MKVPAIDAALGMEAYSTDLWGIGGCIRSSKDHFIVEEILSNPTIGLTKNSDTGHPYPLYVLHKRGIDSNHAIREVEVETGLKIKAAGLKDARAVTRQYVSSVRKHGEAKSHFDTKHCHLDLVGFTTKPITKGNLAGNKFIVTVIDFIASRLEEKIVKLKEMLRNNQIANFYGYQRFGSSRAVTHLVGREIVKRNYKLAVELFLSYPGKYDNEQIREIREACKDDSNYSRLLNVIPNEMDLERILLQELTASHDPVRAIRKLPITIRRLLVHAYQSYLFNRALSKAMKDGYDLRTPKERDICFQFDTTKKFLAIKRFEDRPKLLQLPAMPLVGYAFRNDNRFGEIVSSILQEENISTNEFFIKDMQEVSVEGGFRQLSLICDEFSHFLNEFLRLSFVLYKGCYATVLLRELLKPEDPIAANF